MATKRYSINPENNENSVTEAAGSAVATKNIELTVDWDGLTSAGLTRDQQRFAVIEALQQLIAYIDKNKP